MTDENKKELCVCEYFRGATYSGIPGIVGTDPETCKRCDACERITSDEAAKEILKAVHEKVQETKESYWGPDNGNPTE